MDSELEMAAELLRESEYSMAFTGAGISVESGIPSFRGENGLWSKYDPEILDLDVYFHRTNDAWKVIKEIFYDHFGHAKPNAAHYSLANLEEAGMIQGVITQNIDNLHQRAGSKSIHEFHGNSQFLLCTQCHKRYPVNEIALNENPPLCPDCHGLMKPDFIFFGEAIPQDAYQASVEAANTANVFLVIGTTGKVMPACYIPFMAKENGASIIEINTEESAYTNSITDVFIKGKASILTEKLEKILLS